jgi:uncharacterized RDD family membrane protein YckC
VIDSPATPEPDYPGFVTRAIAFVVDAVVIDLVALVVAAGAALALSLLHLPKDVKSLLLIIGGAAWIAWSVGYFVTFWSTTGQTPGARLMQIRVVSATGDQIKPRRGIVRCIGLVLAALPLLAGYLLILFDSRRRGLQDRIAGTLVVDAPQISLAAARQARTKIRYAARDETVTLGRGEVQPRSSVSGDDRNGGAFHPVSRHGFRA